MDEFNEQNIIAMCQTCWHFRAHPNSANLTNQNKNDQSNSNDYMSARAECAFDATFQTIEHWLYWCHKMWSVSDLWCSHSVWASARAPHRVHRIDDLSHTHTRVHFLACNKSLNKLLLNVIIRCESYASHGIQSTLQSIRLQSCKLTLWIVPAEKPIDCRPYKCRYNNVFNRKQINRIIAAIQKYQFIRIVAEQLACNARYIVAFWVNLMKCADEKAPKPSFRLKWRPENATQLEIR